MDFPGGSGGKASACNVGDLGSIPGLGKSPGGGHGNSLQYSCLENPMDKGTWRTTARSPPVSSLPTWHVIPGTNQVFLEDLCCT